MSESKKNKFTPELRFPEFIKEGSWEEIKLGELGELVNGLTYSPDDTRENGLLVLRSSNIQDGEIVLEDCVYVRENIKGANLSKPGDILICVRNGSKALIGKNAIIPNGIPTSTHGAFMTVFRSQNPKFVHQLFQTDSYIKQVNNDLGATINSINGSNLVKYKFVVPKPAEQQKIADCLSSLDELITAENQKLEALNAHKKGLMQQLFPAEGEKVPKLRFKEFRDSGDWKEKKLGDVAIFSSGGTPSKEVADYWDGDIPWISASSMYSTEITKSDSNITRKAIADGARIAKKGTLLVLVRGSMLFNRIPMGIALRDVAFNQDVKALTLEQGIDNYFLLHQLYSRESQLLDAVTATGIGAGKIDTNDLKETPVHVPSREEQRKITDCVSSLDNLITEQSKKVEFLKSHKKGLIQQLFPIIKDDK